MRRLALFSLAVVATGSLMAACGDDNGSDPGPGNYALDGPNSGSVSVGQDSVISLRDSGLVVVRDGLDTLIGNVNNANQPNVRLRFTVADPEMAIVDAYGLVRGLKPGTTTITVHGYGEDLDVGLTVREHKATSITFTVATQPNGRLIVPASRRDTGTFWALPGDRLSAFVEAVVRVGNDTVYCNRCARKTPPRIMRKVYFRSLRPEIATVRNANNVFVQSTTATAANVDTAGRVLALDTSSTPVPIVVSVPTDGLEDTVYVKFALRPIDRIFIDADSANFPPNNIDQIGTDRRKYPNSDTTAGNFFANATTNFAVRADYVFNVFRNAGQTSADPTSATQVTILRTGVSTNVERIRPTIPLVLWESALPAYAELQSSDFNKAAVVGQCFLPAPACGFGGNATARTNLVITCADNAAKLPGVDQNNRPWGGLPIQFSGLGSYTVPNCSPAKTITPYPGALCTSGDPANWAGFCTIWIRATITDPATGQIRQDLYPLNIRRAS